MATKKPTPAQLAARARFAEMARSGAFKKKRKNNQRKKTVSQKVSQLVHEGYPQRQAVAVALSEQRAGKVKRNPTDWKKRQWISHVDDERNIGHGIIVTLKKGWFFNDGEKEGVRGYDTLTEAKKDTSKTNVSERKTNPTAKAKTHGKVSAVVLMKNPRTQKPKKVFQVSIMQDGLHDKWMGLANFFTFDEAEKYARYLAKQHSNWTIRVHDTRAMK
jgi:hypothetical protein